MNQHPTEALMMTLEADSPLAPRTWMVSIRCALKVFCGYNMCPRDFLLRRHWQTVAARSKNIEMVDSVMD